MDTNSNWRPPQAEPAVALDTGDWRSQLHPDSRQRIVNKIMETLKRHLPLSGQEGLQELRKIAMKFEEKIYTAATSQSDYLRKISLKMLTMESKSQNTLPPNAMASNSTKSPQDPASQNLQMQMQNQSQSLPGQMALNQSQTQARQQLLAQNMQNNIAPAGMQNSVSLQSVSALTQNSIPNTSQNSNLQPVSSISQNSIGNPMGQGVASNVFPNGQRQMQGRQQLQQVGAQQQAQNSQQYVFQQQLQQQIMKQKMQQGSIHQSPLQPQMQQQQQQQQQSQQNLLQQSQLQPTQQSVMQTPSMQPPMMSGLQQNQQSSVQQSSQLLSQQHQQSMLRQQQQQQQQQPPQQTSAIHQLQTQISQQSMMSSQPQQQQQQQLMGQQSSAAAMQQNQLIGQQNSVSDTQQQLPQQQRLIGQPNNLSSLPSQQQNSHQSLQQQQLMGPQNNLANIHQQQLGSQNHVGGLAQQQQLLGTQSGNSTLQSNQHQVHIMQQSKLPVQQHSQSASGLLPGGVQQPQPQPQKQLISHIQSQAPQLQHLGLQQQPNSLQQNMQQRLQPSSSLLQQQNIIDQQQKQIFPSQKALTEAPSTSLDSTAQTGNQIDWQEECYQKVKAMREMYYTDLNEIFQKISLKLQQHDSLPQQQKTDQFQKLRFYKQMLENLLQFLQLPKNNIPERDKVASCERQIISFLNTNRPRKSPSLQQGQLPPHMQSMHQFQQSHLQVPQGQSHDTGMNPQLQSINLQNSTTMQQSNLASLQHGSVSSLTAIASSNLDSGQQNVPSSMQQVNMGSVQQIPVSTPQQSNVNAVPLQSGVNMLQPNISAPQSNSNMLQNQHLKQQQEQQIMQSQQLKYQQRQIQQQLLQKQQIMQQQQLHQLTKQQFQQPGQMQPHQMPQVQISDANDTKLRQGVGGLKPGVLPHHLPQGQRYSIQQVKSGGTFPNSSLQLPHTLSPQINQHSSPQIDQQSMLPPLTKVGTPLQSANSPFVVHSPSTPLAPSPIPGESEKPNNALSSLSNVANMGHQQTIGASVSAPSLAIGTPGISASPLLDEFTVPDGNHGSASTISGKHGVMEKPLERLLKAVSSLSSKELSETVSDIGSIVSMIDRIAGSAPGNGSRAAVGEDLVAMTKCRLQARNFVTQDGSSGTKRMRRYTTAMPLNVVSSFSSMNDSFKQLTASNTSELESTATSNIKGLRNEVNHPLLEEIREVNERLIDTVVEISDEDMNPTMAAAAAADFGEGTVVKCSFTAVTLSPDLKSQYVSQMVPIQPLRMLVPANYPNSSPILLDKFPLEASEYEDLSVKAKSRFRISLRTLSQPMSLEEIARTWDDCTRAVLSEYAQQSGGGTFSSKFGTWEDCLTAA
ncbi:hypothetical protein Dimus_017209 [Dionaea muscipula]